MARGFLFCFDIVAFFLKTIKKSKYEVFIYYLHGWSSGLKVIFTPKWIYLCNSKLLQNQLKK